MHSMRWLLVLAFATSVSAQTFNLTGFISGRGVNASGPASWLEGGFGRLEGGGDRTDVKGLAHLGVDWHPTQWLNVHASGIGRYDPEEFGGDDTGIAEAYADLHKDFGLDEIQLRGGFFFIPTSRENRDDNWASLYTINFSAINTWIGEEVRPMGLDLQYRHTTSAGHFITGGATAFRGNDTMGTLLGWRGWTVGDRLTTYEEVLPLPPIGSLADTGAFWRQRDDGTKPFGPDLDGHTGWSGRLRYTVPQRGSLQYTYLDNGGDRKFYPESGEYSWETRFQLLSGEIGNPDTLIAAGEWMKGDTYMGVFNPYVAAEFESAYVLLSDKRGRNRFTVRYEVFSTTDEDLTTAEDNDEEGHSWTATWMYDFGRNIRGAAEYTDITGDREAAGQYGFDPNTDARSISVEVRYQF